MLYAFFVLAWKRRRHPRRDDPPRPSGRAPSAPPSWGFVTYYVAGQTPTLLALVRDGIVSGPVGTLLRFFAVLMPHLLPSPLTAGDEVYLSDEVVFIWQGPVWYDWLWALAWIVGSLALAVRELRRREL